MKGEKGFNAAHLEKMHVHIHQEQENEYHISIPCLKNQVTKLSEKEIENLFAAGTVSAAGCTYHCN